MTTTPACTQPGCGGHVDADGYCDICGTKAAAAHVAAAATATPPKPASQTAGPLGRSVGTLVTGSARARGSRRTTTTSTRTTSRRAGIGAGLVDVPTAPPVDPAAVVLADPSVAEEKRYCSSCDSPVGRSKGKSPGRLSGFCPKCRHPFDLVPKLSRDDLVGGQYEVVGCLAHGGLGWIYLARDKAVNDRWVVLKGLLDAGDAAATAVALAERRYLAEVEHPNIVGIYNFVTHKGASYIVEEYVGGKSLKQILHARRVANGGKPDPLPVAQAIAYTLAVLPAFTFLHGRRLLYCDFKPDNLIQVGDDVKVIDMGAVRRLDDPSGDVYGTTGFQAPEIADMGPSIPSDVYTIGRTLAVLVVNFKGYTSTYRHTLPDPRDHPALSRFDSLHRLLLKATARHPDDRFQSVAEMGDQLVGVLREVVAVTTAKPQPAPSSVFNASLDDSTLPTLAIDATDSAASFLANLTADDPAVVVAEIDGALQSRQVAESVELRLRRARAHVELGDAERAAAELDRIEADDPWEWRAAWLRGSLELDRGAWATAAIAFERCRAEVPGELAPKLAAALAAEQADDLEAAALLYEVVSGVDPTVVAAAKGLARCRAAAGDIPGALAAYNRIPETHREYARAQLDAVRTLARAGQYDDASSLLHRLDLDDHLRAEMAVEMLSHALESLRLHPPSGAKLQGKPLTERHVRSSLERSLRRLAELTSDDADRFRLVDRANTVRPLTVL